MGDKKGAMVLGLISFGLLAAYLVVTARKFGLPDMISDTYYQLGKRWGWLFSAVMLAVAVMMMAAILDTGKGVQCLAFLGCAGLAFVGVAATTATRMPTPCTRAVRWWQLSDAWVGQ